MAMTDAMDLKTLPGGGLASFLTSNMDEVDDSVLAFGRPAGINSMRDVAERMARMGRGGDQFVVHASEREMMVPREVVEKNPALREQIMESIAAEGADPEAYIIGSDRNSINPYTGQREFFLKKLVSGVKNIVKKVAPVVLPIVGSMILGPVWGAAAGSALNAAIQGGDIKDVLKAGLIGGAAGGVYAGISGAFQGAQAGIGALEGAKAALGSAISPTNVFSGLGSRISENGLLRAYQGPDYAALASPVQGPPDPSTAGVTRPVTSMDLAAQETSQGTFMDRLLGRTPTAAPLTGEARLAEIARLQEAYPTLSPDVIQSALPGAGAAQQSVLQRFGPQLATGLGLAAISGAFNPVEPEAPPTPGYDQTSSELLAANPELYSVGSYGSPQYVGASDVIYSSPQGGVPMVPPVQRQPIGVTPLRFAAQGGEMSSFPRRNGYVSGPGTETSDDVPAMLSDGEFVMTARAVRGAGNGSRERGVRRMYDMMRMFEGGVAR